jgi:TolA-binding protein
MTQSIQPLSWTTINEPHEPHKDLPIKKAISEETMKDLCSLADELNELQKDLESMTKVFNTLNDARTNYLQATQKTTQRLVNFIKNEGKGEKGE